MQHIVSAFSPLGGKHCITNALKQIFVKEWTFVEVVEKMESYHCISPEVF